MKISYNVVEVSMTSWQEIMDSDEADVSLQHLNHWGEKGWELVCVVPKMENGTTTGYGLVFRKAAAEKLESRKKQVTVE
jgi:hypothetical protein